MSITYRTTTYGGSDTPLTNLQVDENFSWLNANKTYTRLKGGSTGTLTSGDINLLAGSNVSISQSGNDITISANDSSINIGDINATGTPSVTTYLRGDGTWAVADSYPTQTGNAGKYLTTNGSTVSWGSVEAGATLTDDISSNTSYYLAMSDATTGTYTTAYVSSSKLYFNPSTGDLSSTSFNSLSDERFKSDFDKITNALDKVKSLTGYTFNLIESNTKSAGLVAQDVDKVLPEAVGGTEDRMTVSYGAIMGLIVEAIKELDDKVSSIQDYISNK